MIIYNLKINGSKVLKISIIIFFLIVLLIFGFCIKKIFFNNTVYVKDSVKKDEITEINTSNYTNILKAVHENLNSYVGTKIKFTGYVYKVFDLKDNQFILARDMIISSDFQAVVVGFLCEYKNTDKLSPDSWVEITGEITKGTYHNEEIPIIKITSLNSVPCPNDEFVYPPDNSYIKTNGLL